MSLAKERGDLTPCSCGDALLGAMYTRLEEQFCLALPFRLFGISGGSFPPFFFFFLPFFASYLIIYLYVIYSGVGDIIFCLIC